MSITSAVNKIAICIPSEPLKKGKFYSLMTNWLEVLMWFVIAGVGIFIMTNVVDWLDKSTKSLPVPLAIVMVASTFLLVIVLQHHFV